MSLLRIMLSVLVAVGVSVAPVASAWANAPRVAAEHVANTHAEAAGHPAMLADAAMDDCASMMMGAPGTDDCPCCDIDKACSPEFCLAKCFQLAGIVAPSRMTVPLAASQIHHDRPEHPPDWSDQPQPPPPRT